MDTDDFSPSPCPTRSTQQSDRELDCRRPRAAPARRERGESPTAIIIAAAATRNRPASIPRPESDQREQSEAPRGQRERPAQRRRARSAPAASRMATTSTAVRPRRPVPVQSRNSKALVEQRGDRGGFGVANRASLFGRTLEDDQRRLHLGAETPDHRLHRIEIDAKHLQVLELGFGG